MSDEFRSDLVRLDAAWAEGGLHDAVPAGVWPSVPARVGINPVRMLMLTLCVLFPLGQGGAAEPGCRGCHPESMHADDDAHRLVDLDCSGCHAGDADATRQDVAHQGLIGSPGELANAQQVCGRCHAENTAGVLSGFMHSGKGMVAVTRHVFGEQTLPEGGGSLQTLGHSPADSLLRKRCASCHLGQPGNGPEAAPIASRGGGCLACHLKQGQGGGHPRLTRRIGDERCVGCHSRSARIALNYAGLAEVDDEALARDPPASLGRLDDGRLVELHGADLHHRAGMACIDCHTGPGLMGSADGLHHHEQAVDIACSDCHDNRNPRISAQGREQLATSRGTPLVHLESTADGLYLHPKLGGPPLKVPPMQAASHSLGQEHQRLTCAACHSTWAPQCYGCHMSYQPDETQWDHVERRYTPGRWLERRWQVDNGLPPLGVTADDRITAFVPGMIYTAEHPEWPGPRFGRLFAATSPHTTGSSRSCCSCHRSARALGLGDGELTKAGEGWRFIARSPRLQDGLPADAWTAFDAALPGVGTRSGERSFDGMELQRVLEVECR